MPPFAYVCNECDCTGWSIHWPPDTRCWQCGSTNVSPDYELGKFMKDDEGVGL